MLNELMAKANPPGLLRPLYGIWESTCRAEVHLEHSSVDAVLGVMCHAGDAGGVVHREGRGGGGCAVLAQLIRDSSGLAGNNTYTVMPLQAIPQPPQPPDCHRIATMTCFQDAKRTKDIYWPARSFPFLPTTSHSQSNLCWVVCFVCPSLLFAPTFSPQPLPPTPELCSPLFALCKLFAIFPCWSGRANVSVCVP